MLTETQQNILTSSIQQRNEQGEPTLAKDVFEVMKKFAMDFALYIENDSWVVTEERFEEFIEQYKPQP